jgi:hypothetical protein
MQKGLPILVPAIWIVSFLLVSDAAALEKRAARAPLDRESEWRSGTETCTIGYYNACTGWVWIWSSWSPEDRIGVHFNTCCSDTTTGNLLTGWMFVETGSPMGYGFTGTVDVWNADMDGCPTGNPITSSTLLPISGWNEIDYAATGGVVVPDSFSFTFTTGPGPTNPLALVTDHPAAGPTGPQACGTCFPVDRVTRTFYLGTPASPLCPGSVLFDGICDAEMLWDVGLSCIVVSVDQTSWSEIKALYR